MVELMLRVPVKLARPGMVLAQVLHHPRRAGAVLLREGFSLDVRTIDRLEELCVRDVWIRYPGLHDLAAHIGAEMREAAGTLAGRIESAMDHLARGGHVRLDYPAYRDAVTGLLAALANNPDAAGFLEELVSTGGPESRHACNVCMISLLIGLKLDFYISLERKRMPVGRARGLADLGMGAMLHDVGMLRLDPAVRERWEATGDESDPSFREHVRLGFDAIKDHADPVVASIVLNHHQRFDGTGFPERESASGRHRVGGHDVHIFARIVAGADLFDRLRYGPGAAGPAPAPAVSALQRLRTRHFAGALDPLVEVALINVVPAYPPGSLVRLSDGRMAAVVSWKPADPCRPLVQVIERLDPRGEPGERLDLAEREGLLIAEAEGQPVLHDNFFPRTAGEFDLHAVCRRMLNRADELAA